MKKTIIILLTAVIALGIAIVKVEPTTYAEEQPTEPTKLSLEEIKAQDEVFYDSDYEFYCELIKTACDVWDMEDYYTLIVSISRLETGNFTSKAFIDGHNFGGLTTDHVLTYERETDGLEAFMATMNWYIYDMGLDTPEKMAKVYCPINDDWAKLVTQIMKEM